MGIGRECSEVRRCGARGQESSPRCAHALMRRYKEVQVHGGPVTASQVVTNMAPEPSFLVPCSVPYPRQQAQKDPVIRSVASQGPAQHLAQPRHSMKRSLSVEGLHNQ